MQITHNNANSAIPDLRAPARVARGPAQNSSSVAAIAAQKILRKSSKVVCPVKDTLAKDSTAMSRM